MVSSVALSSEPGWFEHPSNTILAFPLTTHHEPSLIMKRWDQRPSMLRFGERKEGPYFQDQQLLRIHRRHTVKLLLL